MGHPPTPSSPSSLLSSSPPIGSAQRAPPARHNREESILLGATDRRDLLALPRLASRRCPSRAISFSVRFLIPALLRAVGPPTSVFQDLLASLAKVASDGGEINRSPQSCIHLNCRVMCTLPEAPHRFVDSSGLRQATCGRGWSTASTTLSGTRPSVLCPVLTPYTKPFFLVLQLKLVHSSECARGVENGFLNQELCLPKPGFSELQPPSIENTCSFTSPATSKRDLCRVQKLAVAEGKEIQPPRMLLLDATKVLRW
jgi:hypothetical protein